MGATSRTKGRKFEQDVAAYLRGNGFGNAERAVRNGWRTDTYTSDDPFDIWGCPGLLWSLKNYDAASEEQHLRWLHEVHDTATERGLVGILVSKRKGRSDVGAAHAWRLLPQSHLAIPWLPVRTSVECMVRLLRAEGYGNPLPSVEATTA